MSSPPVIRLACSRPGGRVLRNAVAWFAAVERALSDNWSRLTNVPGQYRGLCPLRSADRPLGAVSDAVGGLSAGGGRS